MTDRYVTQLIYSDGTTQDVPAPAPAVQPPIVVAPASGIVLGTYTDQLASIASAPAKALGARWIRTWYTVDWSVLPTAASFDKERAWQAAGLKTLVVFTPPEKTGAPPPNPGIASDWFAAAMSAAEGAVDAWEIFNEPNLSNYNTSYLQCSTCWIKNALAPAYGVLNGGNQFVVSGGWSGNPGDENGAVAWMVKNGLLDYSDAVGHHPYGSSVAQQLQYVQAMRARIGNKPLWITEWNLHESLNDPLTWATDLSKAAAAIKPYVQGVFHFRLDANNSQAGVAAPYTSDMVPRVPWLDNTVAAMKALSQ